MKVLKCSICGKETEVADITIKVICTTCISEGKGVITPPEVIPETPKELPKESNEVVTLTDKEIEKVAEKVIGDIGKKPAQKKISRSGMIKELIKQGKSTEEIFSKLKETFPEVSDSKLHNQISVIKSAKKRLEDIKLSAFIK